MNRLTLIEAHLAKIFDRARLYDSDAPGMWCRQAGNQALVGRPGCSEQP